MINRSTLIRFALLASLALFCIPAGAANKIHIKNVAVFDGKSSSLIEDQELLIVGSMISEIGQNLATDATTIIDGGGRVLMPGIIEAHNHLSIVTGTTARASTDPIYAGALAAEAARGFLLRGWTTVRDIGGPSQGLAKAINEGSIIGPRIYPSAMVISQTSGHGDWRAPNDLHPNMEGSGHSEASRYSLLADGPTEVRRAVRESLRKGAVQIKLMAGGGISSDYDPLDTVQFTLEEMRAAVEAAADWGTYVTVHAYTDKAVQRALEAGVKVIEHGHLTSDDTLKLIKKNNAYLSIQSFGYTYKPPIPAGGRSNRPPDPRGQRAIAVAAGTDRVMRAAKRLGLKIAFGSDMFTFRNFATSVKEFGARKNWFSSVEILQQATSVNAEILALTGPRNPYPDGPLGVIAEGAYADLLIVEGNPLEDAAILEDYENNLRLIMKNGVIYKQTL